MDCPPDLIQYLHPPDDMNNFENKFVADNFGNTIFYQLANKLYRFNIDETRKIAAFFGKAIPAFVTNINPHHAGTISTNEIMANLECYENVIKLNHKLFKNRNTLELSWDGNEYKINNDLLPQLLNFRSSYFNNNYYSNNVYIPNAFYQAIYTQYGQLNDFTVLLLFLTTFSDNDTIIKISNSVPDKLDILCPDIISKIHPDDLDELIESYIPEGQKLVNNFYHSNIKPITKLSSEICCCCYLSKLSDWNMLFKYLRDDNQYQLIFNYPASWSDDEIETINVLINQNFPTATHFKIPDRGADIGAFFQAINYLYSNCLDYKYLLKLHLTGDYCADKISLDFLFDNLSEHITMMNANPNIKMRGKPLNKFDFLHLTWIMKYLRKFRIHYDFNDILAKKVSSLSNFNSQISRKSTPWKNLSRKNNNIYIPTGIFIVNYQLILDHIRILNSFSELTANTHMSNMKTSYHKQYPELAWHRIFGIIGYSLSF